MDEEKKKQYDECDKNENASKSSIPLVAKKWIAIGAIAFGIIVIFLVIIFGGAFTHTHEFSAWVEIKVPTCNFEGTLERTCKCGERQTQSVPVIAHSYGDWVDIKTPTCSESGISESSCTACGETKAKTINKIGHSYGEWTILEDATCTKNGSKEKVCTECDDRIVQTIESTGHSFGNWQTTTNATCTDNGTKKQTCSKCNEVKTEVIKATGYSLSSATCTDPKSCRNGCGYIEGKALGHIDVGGYCSRCGESLEIDMNTVVGHPDECETTSYFGFCFYKNSADGIKVCWGGENLSGKTINYYTVTIYFYNSVGDPAYSEITGECSKTIKYVGPVAPNEDLIIFSIVDYVPVCSKVVIGEITLEYSDGTTDSGWYGWSTTYKNSAIK